MTAENILKNIESDLAQKLNKCGIMFRIFSRVKSEKSINSKILKKAEKYRQNKEKMQDMLALRITLYFSDDVDIVYKHLKSSRNFVSESFDVAEVDRFHPQRLNLVMRVPDDYSKGLEHVIAQTEYSDIIDNTYEIQIRTILSEGWHEVEHDLRYKCHDAWENHTEESRLLNGIYASLESSEWAMLTLFDRLSYSHYKAHNWNYMLLNKMRMRFADNSLSENLSNYLSDNPTITKKIFRYNRSDMVNAMMNTGFSFPLTYDTVLHILNYLSVKDEDLLNLADPVLQKELQALFDNNE